MIKQLVLGLGLIAGVALAAQAQTVSGTVTPGPSIANLPPDGPRPNSLGAIPGGQHMPVTESGNYIGPAPGATNGQMPPRFEKPADWEQNTALHPYSSNLGPKPN